MTNGQKLLRDIAALKESIEIQWDDLALHPLREEEGEVVRLHIEQCQAELQNLLERLITAAAVDRNY